MRRNAAEVLQALGVAHAVKSQTLKSERSAASSVKRRGVVAPTTVSKAAPRRSPTGPSTGSAGEIGAEGNDGCLNLNGGEELRQRGRATAPDGRRRQEVRVQRCAPHKPPFPARSRFCSHVPQPPLRPPPTRKKVVTERAAPPLPRPHDDADPRAVVLAGSRSPGGARDCRRATRTTTRKAGRRQVVGRRSRGGDSAGRLPPLAAAPEKCPRPSAGCPAAAATRSQDEPTRSHEPTRTFHVLR